MPIRSLPGSMLLWTLYRWRLRGRAEFPLVRQILADIQRRHTQTGQLAVERGFEVNSAI